MDRIIGQMDDGTLYVRSETGEEGTGYFTTQRRLPEIVSKLYHYEKTGLSPEEVMQYKALGAYEEIRDGLAEFRRLLAVAEPYLTCGLSPERVEELARADREGRIVVLPCKVGDLVYYLTEDGNCIFEGDYDECDDCNYCIKPIDDLFRDDPDEWECDFKPHVEQMYFDLSMVDAYGKTVFLTREEAEAALKERENNEVSNA